MLVPVEGPIEVVAKAADADEDAALELVRIAMYEALSEMAEQERFILESDMDAFVAKAAKAKRALVRSFVEKRMAGDDVEDVVKAAAELTLLEELVSKDTPDNPDTGYWDARGEGGRFAPAQGGSSLSRGARNLMSVLTRGKERTNPYAGSGQKWAESKPSQRLAGAGDILASMDNPQARAVGYAAQFVGEVGPEAQQVLGRHLRRTAYRYRGTERKPNADTASNVKAAGAYASQIAEGNQELEAALQRDDAKPGVKPPSRSVNTHYLSSEYDEFSPDQRRLAVQGDVAAANLLRQLPTQTSAMLSRHAGRTAPSIGILIDADGDVVSEAQGFNGDHYVPFDLKNLKRMTGGQYVRTRTMGGPTSEDIYTGLLGSARQVQVVSNSGVFTLEFDPSVRGGRRYSDKAKQMVSRYTKLLESVGSQEVVQNPLSLEERRTLRETAFRRAYGDQDKANKIFNELQREKIAEANFVKSPEDIEEAAAEQAAKELNNPDARSSKTAQRNLAIRTAEIAREMRRAEATKQAKFFRLDGEGYAAALDALKEEFPFYIRSVRHETLPEFVERRKLHDPRVHAPVLANRGVDNGYVNTAAGQLQVGDRKTTAAAEPDAAAATDGAPKQAAGFAPSGPSAPQQRTYEQRKDDLVRDNVIEKKTKPLALNLDDSPELVSRLTASIRQTREFVKNGYITDDDALQGKHDLEFWSSDNEKVAYYLHHNQTPQKFMAGLKDPKNSSVLEALARLREGNVDNEAMGDGLVSSGKAALDRLLSAANLQEPFASSGKFDTPPADDNPKPQRLPEIVDLGNKVENYNNYLNAAATKEKPLVDKIANLQNLAPDQQARKVREQVLAFKRALKAIQEDEEPQDGWDAADLRYELKNAGQSESARELKRWQTAWAFVHARKLATDNQEIVGHYGEGGDMGKALAPEAGPLLKADRVAKADDLSALVPLVHPESPVGRLLHRHLDALSV